MRALTILAVTGVALSVHSVSLGADLPLSVLNGGPSSDSIPMTNADPVAFILTPREIVNPGIPTNLPIADANEMSLLVQDGSNPMGTGVRNRSRAVLAAFDTNNSNSPLMLVQADLDFDATITDSYFVFLNADDAANIDTVAGLASFVANGTAGVDYVQVFLSDDGFSTGSGPSGSFADLDLQDINLNVGALAFLAADFLNIDPGAPGASDGDVGSALQFELGLLVLSDGNGPSPDVPTEYFCVRTSPMRVAPAAASLEDGNDVITIRADLPLVTDGGGTVSFSDTNAGALNGDDFRVRVNGDGASFSLGDFLAGLDTPRVVIGAVVTGELSDTIEIVLDGPLSPSDALLVRNSTVGFASETASGSVYSFAGEDPNPSLNSYLSMGGPACPAAGNADTNFDNVINFTDLNTVLTDFGQVGAGFAGDVDRNGAVNFADLNAVLSAFGMSCE